jgi:hypothetical protein
LDTSSPTDSGEATDSGDAQDSGDGDGSQIDGCPKAAQLEGADILALEHKEWGEASEFLIDYGEATADQTLKEFDAREDWAGWLAERGLYDPLPEVDLDANDLLLIHQLDSGCISATWTFDEAYLHDDSRVVIGTHDRPPEDPENPCEATWVDVHLLVVGEAEPTIELCLDEAEYGGPRGSS